jgi:phage gp36-like protein
MGVAYATRADLYKYGIPSAALVGVSASDQDAQLEAASRVVDSYLPQRYSTPLLHWETDIREAVAILAAYKLFAVRQHPEREDTEYRERYDRVVVWLERVSAQKNTPAGLIDNTSSVIEGAPVGWSDDERGWTGTEETIP